MYISELVDTNRFRVLAIGSAAIGGVEFHRELPREGRLVYVMGGCGPIPYTASNSWFDGASFYRIGRDVEASGVAVSHFLNDRYRPSMIQILHGGFINLAGFSDQTVQHVPPYVILIVNVCDYFHVSREWPKVFKRIIKVKIDKVRAAIELHMLDGYCCLAAQRNSWSLAQFLGSLHHISLLAGDTRIPYDRHQRERINEEPKQAYRIRSLLLVIIGFPFVWWSLGWGKGLYVRPSQGLGFLLASISLLVGITLWIIGITGLTIWTLPT